MQVSSYFVVGSFGMFKSCIYTKLFQIPDTTFAKVSQNDAIGDCLFML